jgi:hypothetical protein
MYVIENIESNVDTNYIPIPCIFLALLAIHLTDMEVTPEIHVLKIIKTEIEGSCISQGYVRPFPIGIRSISMGKLEPQVTSI